MGLISFNTKIKWKGLINVSGFHVDPGFRGKLIYSVYNAGPSSIHLSRGQELFLLWIADLDRSASAKYSRKAKPPLTEISNNLISDVDRPIHSLQSLSNKIEKVEGRINNFITALKIISGIIGFVITCLGAYWTITKIWNVEPQPVMIKGANEPPGTKIG